MDWKSLESLGGTWNGEISNLEAKQQVAQRLAERLQPGDVVGVGSGSTSFLAAKALAARANNEGISFTAIPTSYEVGWACASLGITTTSLQYARPTWSFDGCDEIDEKQNMIKGRGGAMFREKMVMSASPEIFIVADASKIVDQLGKNFAVPIEIDPDALPATLDQLQNVYPEATFTLRPAGGKDGPVITEAGNVIVDGKFSIATPELERELAAIPGIVETGLFCGFSVELVTG